MKEILAGTYWLAADKDGSRCICQGNKPTKFVAGWIIKSPIMGWISLDNDIHPRAKRGDKILSKEDFQDLVFPKITFEEGPIEIEIGKSGRVYTYESEHTKEDTKTP